MSYKSNIGVGFTFNPTLSISLSSAGLVISNLTPGTTESSNAIDINVSTNNVYGYNLYATVGNEVYDNTNLNYQNNDANATTTANAATTNTASTNAFTSIPTTANLSNLDTDNTWGYSYSLDNRSSWSNYSGLPFYTSDSPTRLKRTTEPSSDAINFKIAAKASSTQPSGIYSNVVNFIAITKPTPITLADAYAAEGKELYHGYYKMQDMSHAICEEVEDIGAQLQVIDVRDDKVYWISKLADGNCWMTQNLDLTGGTEFSFNDTDFTDAYTLPETGGWTVVGNKLVLPASNIDGFSTDNYAYVYNSKNVTNCGFGEQYTPCHSYYSWDAATIGSGRSLNTTNTDAPYSICPKGWKLPTARTTSAPNWQTESDFYILAHNYGLNSDISTSESNNNFYTQAGPGTAPNFLLAGIYYYGSFVGIDQGSYWSSSSNGIRAFGLSFSANEINAAANNIRRYGCSVRCLAR